MKNQRKTRYGLQTPLRGGAKRRPAGAFAVGDAFFGPVFAKKGAEGSLWHEKSGTLITVRLTIFMSGDRTLGAAVPAAQP